MQVILFLFGLVNAGVMLRGYDTGSSAVLGRGAGRPARSGSWSPSALARARRPAPATASRLARAGRRRAGDVKRIHDRAVLRDRGGGDRTGAGPGHDRCAGDRRRRCCSRSAPPGLLRVGRFARRWAAEEANMAFSLKPERVGRERDPSNRAASDRSGDDGAHGDRRSGERRSGSRRPPAGEENPRRHPPGAAGARQDLSRRGQGSARREPAAGTGRRWPGHHRQRSIRSRSATTGCCRNALRRLDSRRD